MELEQPDDAGDQVSLAVREDSSLVQFESAEGSVSHRQDRRAIEVFTLIGLIIALLALIGSWPVFGAIGAGGSFAVALSSYERMRRKKRMVDRLRTDGVRVSGRVENLSIWSGSVSIRYTFTTHDTASFEGEAMVEVSADDIRHLVPIIAYDPESPVDRHTVVGWRERSL